MKLLKSAGKCVRGLLKSKHLGDAPNERRRVFMTTAAAAPIAVPALATVLSNTTNANSLGMLAGSLSERYVADSGCTASPGKRTSITERIKNIRDEILEIEKTLGDRKLSAIQRFRIADLEIDLAVNKSMSLATKVRIQAERNAIKQVEERKSYLKSQIEWLLNDESTSSPEPAGSTFSGKRYL